MTWVPLTVCSPRGFAAGPVCAVNIASPGLLYPDPVKRRNATKCRRHRGPATATGPQDPPAGARRRSAPQERAAGALEKRAAGALQKRAAGALQKRAAGARCREHSARRVIALTVQLQSPAAGRTIVAFQDRLSSRNAVTSFNLHVASRVLWAAG